MITNRGLENFLLTVFNSCTDDPEIEIGELFGDSIEIDEEDLQDKSYNVANYDVSATTFERAGVLTSDRGLVLKVGDSEFQITIVRSR